MVDRNVISPRGRTTMRRNVQTRNVASRSIVRIVPLVLLTLIAVSMVYPLLFLASVAFKSPHNFRSDPFGVPNPPTLGSIVDVFARPEFFSGIANSLMVCILATVLTVLLGSMAGWSLVKLGLPYKHSIRGTVIMLMVVPATILIVPVFVVVRLLELQNNPIGLILVYAGLQLPFATYMMSSFFHSVPDELTQAASIDGAGSIRTFLSVAVPLSQPALIALATLVFLNCWSDLLFSLVILQQPGQRTLQVVLTTLTNPILATPEPTVTAGLLLSTVPNLLLFALFNRQLTHGITAGAVK